MSYEPWAEELRATYARLESAAFILHDNIHDLLPLEGRYLSCRRYVEEMLRKRDYMIVHYDVSRGMRFADDRDAEDFLERANRGRLGDARLMKSIFDFPRNPEKALGYIEALATGMEGASRPLGILIDYADQLAPSALGATLSQDERVTAVTLERMARLFYDRLQEPMERDVVLLLLSPNLHDIHPMVVRSELVTAVRVPRPNAQMRRDFIEWMQEDLVGKGLGRVQLAGSLDEVVEQTAGLTLLGVRHIFLKAVHTRARTLEPSVVMARKRELIERDSKGMLEIVQPSHGMEAVGGHQAIKAMLMRTAHDLGRGEEDVPAGMVCPGPNGVGKTFIAKAFAKESGLNCVQLKNFRGMYVGQTEGNLDLIFSILRSMTPNVVIIDEADKMLGNERSRGDSGVDDRVFGSFTAFMGDPALRGKIFWMLLTARPFDLAPDTGRPGRAEEHLPILPPQTPEDQRDVLEAVTSSAGVRLIGALGGQPSEQEFERLFATVETLTPAAMALIAHRARRKTRTSDPQRNAASEAVVDVTMETLLLEASRYVPDGSSAKLRLQTVEAVLYTNHLDYLAEPWRSKLRERPEELFEERARLRLQVGYDA